MLEYNKEILSIYTAQSENGLNDVVKRVTWKYQVKDGSYAADIFKDTYFSSVNSQEFIAYDNLTEDTIQDWIDDVENMEELKTELDTKLQEVKNPTKVSEKQKPWVDISVYDYNDMYALFHESKLVVGPIYWSSGSFNARLKWLGLPESLPEDILARQRKIVPINQPLIIDEATGTKIYKCVTLNEQQENSLFEDNDYIEWNLNVWPIEGTYQLVDRPLDVAKDRLTGFVSEIRNEKEISGVDITIQNKTVKSFTGPVARLNVIQKLNQLENNETTLYKFMDNEWLTIDRNELELINLAVQQHIDSLDAWEQNINSQIKNATTVNQLKSIEVE